MSNDHIYATVLGIPRIGPHRELKKALEAYWSNPTTGQELANTATALNKDYADRLLAAGIDSIPSTGNSYYDAMLDTSALLGVLPKRFSDIPDHSGDGLPPFIDRLFAAARGTADLPASAMTKWFDTNYHYIVPELSADSSFQLDLSAVPTDTSDRPVLVGPVTYLGLSRSTDGSEPLDLLEKLTATYTELLSAFPHASWVQLDEPFLVTDLSPELLSRVRSCYEALITAAHAAGLKLLVTFPYGSADVALKTLSHLGIDGFAVDLVSEGTNPELPEWSGKELLFAGVVDGRNIWRTDLDQALAVLQQLATRGPVGVSTSCSLLHVPHTLVGETSLDNDPELKSWLAFGDEKAHEVALLSRLLQGTATAEDQQSLTAARTALKQRAASKRTHDAAVRARIDAVTTADRSRSPFANRRVAQMEVLNLPQLPTTTIGSFPQTAEIRSARAQLRRGDITFDHYQQLMEQEINEVIGRQEELGLDVLVHGEPERNDMVQYFSEQLAGYHSTDNGWVQSYGSRCVRPPVLYGDVSRPQPMTVKWYQYAAERTEKPVKGMLTGPVTMLAWSFVRNDQPLSTTADQVALALRDEIDDLITAGARIIQVDEPAIRELLPLRAALQPDYLTWAVGAFRLATGGAPESVQIHTHMCYSSFNELIATVKDLDADVTTIEAARAGMRVLGALRDAGFNLGIGPGVWDIHSPRVPTSQEVSGLISAALESVDPDLLWINPDCGLKTRGWPETTASLKVLVDAAKQARS